MEGQAIESDLTNIHLQIIGVEELILDFEKTNKPLTNIVPKALLLFRKIQLVSQKVNVNLSLLIKELYQLIALIMSSIFKEQDSKLELNEVALIVDNNQFLVQNAAPLLSDTYDKIKKIRATRRSIQHKNEDQPQAILQFEFNPYSSQLKLDRYTANDAQIRKEMQQFIKCVKDVQQNSDSFFRQIMISQEAKFSSVQFVNKIYRQNQEKKVNTLKIMEQKYNSLLEYLKSIIKNFEVSQEQFLKQKQELLAVVNAKVIKKEAMARFKKMQKETQTPFTNHQLCKLQFEIHAKALQIQSRQDTIKDLMKQIYQLQINHESQKLKKQSNQSTIHQNVKVISSLKDHFLQMCEYASEMEYTQNDLNNKIQQLGNLGLQDYVDEKEFSSFTMDFKVSLFNIFRNITTKFTKVNEESKKKLEDAGRRNGICQLRKSQMFNNYRRMSKKVSGASSNFLVEKLQKMMRQQKNQSSDNKQQSQNSQIIQSSKQNSEQKQQVSQIIPSNQKVSKLTSKRPSDATIVKSNQFSQINQNNYQVNSVNNVSESEDDVINEEIVRQTKRGFVSSIMKLHNNKKSRANAPHRSLRMTFNTQKDQEEDLDLSLHEDSKKSKKSKILSNIKWKIQQKSNIEINQMIQQSLTSKFQVVEKSINEMNNQIMQSEKYSQKQKSKVTPSPSQNCKLEAIEETHTQPLRRRSSVSSNKLKTKMKSILSKSSQWGLRKNIRHLMTQQSQNRRQSADQDAINKFLKPSENNIHRRASKAIEFPFDTKIQKLRGSLTSSISETATPKVATGIGIGLGGINGVENLPNQNSKKLKSSVILKQTAPTQSNQLSQSQYISEGTQLKSTRLSDAYFFKSKTQSRQSRNQMQTESQDNVQIPRFSSFYRQSKLHKYSSSEIKTIIEQNSQLQTKSPHKSKVVHQQLNRIKLRKHNLRNDKVFMNELRLVLNAPTSVFNKTIKQKIDLQQLIYEAQQMHLQKCGSYYCTHLLRFFQVLKRIADTHNNRQQLVTKTFKIQVIQKQNN